MNIKDKNEISKLVNELIPKIFVDVLYDKMSKYISTAVMKARSDSQSLCYLIAENTLRNNKIIR